MELEERLISKVASYRPSTQRLAALRDTPLLFMVGVSGAGKNILSQQLLQKYPDRYYRFVSHTTRKQRLNHGVMEQQGLEYHFISHEDAERMLDDQDFLETNLYSGNIYGTSISEIQHAHDEGKILIGDIDVNGVAHFMHALPNGKPVFILPPDYQTWQRRLMTRYEDGVNKEDWRSRMLTARREIEHALVTDYYYLVVNDDLSEATETIHAIACGKLTDHRPTAAVHAANQILCELNKVL
jgi:guanylate kinase